MVYLLLGESTSSYIAKGVGTWKTTIWDHILAWILIALYMPVVSIVIDSYAEGDSYCSEYGIEMCNDHDETGNADCRINRTFNKEPTACAAIKIIIWQGHLVVICMGPVVKLVQKAPETGVSTTILSQFHNVILRLKASKNSAVAL